MRWNGANAWFAWPDSRLEASDELPGEHYDAPVRVSMTGEPRAASDWPESSVPIP